MSAPRREDRCLDGMATVFAALGSSTRFTLMVRLAERPYSVNELAAATGMKQANVSQQLGILKRAGLVRSTRTGTTVTYSTDGPDIDRIVGLAIELLHGIVRRRVLRLGSG